MNSTSPVLPPPVATNGRAWRYFLLCCFAGIFGLRAFLIERFGASIASVDEWEATGREILQAWRGGTLSLAMLFEAHNGDHRIVATRLWEIFWYVVNGTWDPLLIMIAKATIYSAAATIFIHLLTHALPRWRFLAATLLAGLFAFPFNYQNMLWGFQSQFDFFLLAVALGWLALQSNRPVAALVVAFFSLFTLGAGPILAASYLPFFVVAWTDKRWSFRKAVGFAGVSLAIVAFGVSLRAEHAAPLGTPGEQAKTLTTLMAWPHSSLISIINRLPETERLIPRPLLHFPSAETSWLNQVAALLHAQPGLVPFLNVVLALLLLAPTIVVAVLVARRQIRGTHLWGALGLAGFAFLMQIATAIARAQEVGVPIRYLDVIALSLFSALACGFALSADRPRFRRLFLLWTVVAIPACLATMVGTLSVLRKRQPDTWVANMRAYFPSHDHAIFRRIIAEDPNWPLPFFSNNVDQLMSFFDDPGFEAIMPLSVIAPNQPPHPIGRAARAVGRAGWLIVLVSIGTGAWIVFRPMRRMEISAPDVGRNVRLRI
jgi:hypothetical protein